MRYIGISPGTNYVCRELARTRMMVNDRQFTIPARFVVDGDCPVNSHMRRRFHPVTRVSSALAQISLRDSKYAYSIPRRKPWPI